METYLILFFTLAIIGSLLNYHIFGLTSAIMTFISVHLFALSFLYKNIKHSLKLLLRIFAIFIMITNFLMVVNVAKLPLITLIKKPNP